MHLGILLTPPPGPLPHKGRGRKNGGTGLWPVLGQDRREVCPTQGKPPSPVGGGGLGGGVNRIPRVDVSPSPNRRGEERPHGTSIFRGIGNVGTGSGTAEPKKSTVTRSPGATWARRVRSFIRPWSSQRAR